MATLTSIKNKYLDADDGTVLGATTNTENISLLSFKLATADSLSKFNLVDGFADDYNDATGVDASGSTNESRNSSGKYYSGAVTVGASGGTETTDGADTIHKFTSSGNFITDTAQTVEYLIVGGGGGGGGNGSGTHGGGGGAGGYRAGTSSISAATYAVVVGTGGPGGSTSGGGTGALSSWNSIAGAGGGGGGNSNTASGQAGGSGGGAGRQTSAGAGNTPSTSPAQGFAGGAGVASGTGNGSGGGGGASEVGANAGVGAGGAGGDGIQNDIMIASTNVYYAGGGGGYAHSDGGGAGGPGGAGGGGPSNMPSRGDPATAGTDGLGGGGGGGGHYDAAGMVGGSGVVIIRHATVSSFNNMTLLSNAYTAQSDPTTARIIMDEYTSTGSSTLNTDIKAYASRDNGGNYTQITLSDQGTVETNHRLLSGSVDISGQPSGAAVIYKIETLNQSASKVTRVYGTSMAWA